MTGFKPGYSGIGSDDSAVNCATTIAQRIQIVYSMSKTIKNVQC